MGGVFEGIANVLPFVHAVELERAVLDGRMADTLPHIGWVVGYALVVTVAAVAVFLRQMRRK